MSKGHGRKPPVMLATLFRRARKVLDKRGWCQHDLQDYRGACCLYGALNAVGTGHPMQFPEDGAASWYAGPTSALAMLLGLGDLAPFDQHCAIVDWNNAGRRRKSDVIALLKRAELKAAREKARLAP